MDHFYKELETTWFELANAVKALTQNGQVPIINNNTAADAGNNFNNPQ